MNDEESDRKRIEEIYQMIRRGEPTDPKEIREICRRHTLFSTDERDMSSEPRGPTREEIREAERQRRAKSTYVDDPELYPWENYMLRDHPELTKEDLLKQRPGMPRDPNEKSLSLCNGSANEWDWIGHIEGYEDEPITRDELIRTAAFEKELRDERKRLGVDCLPDENERIMDFVEMLTDEAIERRKNRRNENNSSCKDA